MRSVYVFWKGKLEEAVDVRNVEKQREILELPVAPLG
jgi:hypothetical protein